MRTWLRFIWQMLMNMVFIRLADEIIEGGATTREKLPTWAIVLIVIGGLLLICILVPVCVIIVLALMGPSIGTVFSNIIEELDVTPEGF